VADVLSLVLECRNAHAGGAALVLDGIDEVTFGRGPARNLEAPDGLSGKVRWTVRDSRMSSTHARLRRTPEGWWLEDLGSANGTHVDGVSTPRALIEAGAVIRIGHTLFLWGQHEVNTTPPAWTDSFTLGFSDELRVFATLHVGLRERLEELRQAAVAGSRILVSGEVGTGKLALARATHRLSGAAGAFVVAEATEMSAALLDDRFTAAKGGTLFIREVEALSDEACGALRSGLSAGEARVVSATRLSPDRRDAEGQLAGLWGELSDFEHVAIPLRERKEDLGLLIAALVPERGTRLRPEVGIALLDYDWPRNIRELSLCMATCFGMVEDETVRLADLPGSIAEAIGETPRRPSDRPGSVRPASLRPSPRTSFPPAAAVAHPKPPKR